MLKRIVSACILPLLLLGLANAAPMTYAPAVKKAAPAVVNVYILRADTSHKNASGYTKGFHRLRSATKNRMVLGSGVLMDKRGYILTNSHVIRDRAKILVALSDGRSARAEIIGGDPETDLAVLKINLKQLPMMEIGNSNDLQVGDVVLAIGNPFGLGRTVTQGIISALGRTAVGLSNIENFIQTDVALNPGSSGGALINTEGKLIGINTGIYTRSGGYQGVSFAIPVNEAENILQQIIKYGVVKRGWLGVDVVNLDPILIYDLKLKQTMGVVVKKISDKSPVLNKLQENDVIVEINGRKLHDENGFMSTVAQSAPGTDVTLTYYRGNQRHTLTVKLGATSADSGRWQDVKVKGKKHRYPDDRT